MSRLPLLVTFIAAGHPALAQAVEYTTRSAVLRAEARDGAGRAGEVDANQTISVLERRGDWARIRVGADRIGWLPADAVSDVWVKVWKKERRLLLIKGDTVEREMRIALGGQDPISDKRKRGDGATPEGRFFISELGATPEAARYGARSMRLSYPGADDARRGLSSGLISRAAYLDIVRAVRAGTTPPQNTPLGGSIRIHGGGARQDWTLGCVALDDEDAVALYARVARGTRVDIYPSKAEDERLSTRGHLARAILSGAKQQVSAQALYTTAAMRTAAVGFPGGDIDPKQAVCTDVIVRALRSAGLDLQPLVHEDRVLHGTRYPDRARTQSAQLDHRRVRNLVPYFQHVAATGAFDTTAGMAPGDIVVFDTGIPNGTRFDHIGIIDDVIESGQMKAINIWTVGYRTSSMALIGQAYPTVTAWFRLGHPYDFE